MKYLKPLLLVLLTTFGLVVSAAAAGPYLVCNPYTGADYFVVTGLPATIEAGSIPPDVTGTYGFKLDVGGLAAGNYRVTAKACSNQWGCSDDSDPFDFARPSLSPAPANIRLSK